MDAHLDEAVVREYFGESWERVNAFAEILGAEGEVRGLIGPRELDRLWDRHILNSAAVVPYLPVQGSVADLGSGAGLPGLVIACMLPDVHVRLIEPMERRCAWLTEAIDHVGLTSVEVLRGRAEEFHGAFTVSAVTARAVAALDKLSRWAVPLLESGGELVVLKGRSVEQEIEPARKVLRKFKMSEPEILEARTIDAVEATTVVRSVRG
ncbi:16S rRNA (guanine(527)-N(7))-methyltransferase RsmG [Jonesia quinghaiensis]|uniref:16S rRNA (guanine(527)-N(7))-methyltransferase RsmG n=1 Tax=Jonesia quinghaiensis TaxID=262806 RepID=UPI00055B9AED|nr:16S rRNA (guanine(527)-N(7))-methyltransferase RsmG [Jonesia quinghaiensis]